MSKVTRRDFLKLAGLTSASAALAAAGCKPGGPSGPESPAPGPPGPTGDQAYLVVVHGPDPAAITETAIQALGGIERFVKSGDDVIVKPNICVNYSTFEYASTTNPTVVATLVRLCLGAGAAIPVLTFGLIFTSVLPILGTSET